MSRMPFQAQSFTRKPNYRAGMKDVFWPCRLYSVSLLAEDERLNMFESAVLRLVRIGISDPAVIGEKLNFPDWSKEKPDSYLAKFILNRLEKKKLINGGILTEEGNHFIQEGIIGVYKTITVYFDLIGGKLLPFYTQNQQPFLMSNDEGEFYLGEWGGSNKLKNPFILKRSTTMWDVPTPAEVVRALAEYEKIRAVTPYFADMEPEFTRFIADRGAIKVQNNPRPIHLHCLCALADNSKDILIRNPFGFDDYLQQMTDAFTLSTEYDRIKSELLSRVKKKDQENHKLSLALAWGKEYPEIARDVEDMARAMNMGRRDAFMRSALAALEHILRRFFVEKGEKKWAELFQNSTVPNILAMLENFARSMEQELDDETIYFLSPTPGEIFNALQGKVNIRSLLALNLPVANLDSHPLGMVLRTKPGAIKLMQRLNYMRNEAAHGGEEVYQICEEDIAACLDLIHCLLRAWQPGKRSGLEELRWKDNFEHNMADVEKSLQAHIPQSIRNKFSRHLDQLLIKAEEQFLSYGLDEIENDDVSQQCVMDFAAFCQHALPIYQHERLSAEELWDRALDNAKNAGFDLFDAALPQSLSNADKTYVERAAIGGKTTLGGQCVVWLAATKLDNLKRIAAQTPDLLLHVDRLIQLRGHGNDNVPTAAVVANKRDIYRDICIIWGDESNG